MPGIAGLITTLPRKRAEEQLSTMLGTLCHESFYVTGSWANTRLGVYVGWTARAGSFSDGMPLTSGRGDTVLVFSGEDHSRTDAQRGGSSYLLEVLEEEPAFPACLNGWFHGLIAKQACGTVTLFNDRFGMHRLYYHEATDAFYFAAEAKAILAVRPELRQIDPHGLGEWIECGCVLEGRSLFQGIRVLPPASTWEFRDGAVARKTNYFQPREWEEQETISPQDLYTELRDAFSSSLPRHFDGQERVGMSLTGGLDTRMIMAWHKPRRGSLPCYTFGGTYRDCRDVVVARHVAQACGQSHEVITCGPEFIARFPHYAERAVYLTDAGADVSCSPVLYSCQQARDIAPARMTGNYGDQVLRGLRAFKPKTPVHGLFASDLLPLLTAARDSYSRAVDTHPLTFAAFRQAPWHHHGLLALEQTQLTMRSPYLDNEVVRTLFRAPAVVTTNNDLRLRLIESGSPALRAIRTDMGFGGRGNRLTGTILRNYHTFTFKAEYAYDHGMPQWLSQVDHMLAPLHLDRLFLGRHKYYHFRVWYRDVLSRYVREMLLDPLTLSRPYWHKKRLEELVEQHVSGVHNYTYEIHKVLSLELAHRLLIDKQITHGSAISNAAFQRTPLPHMAG